MVEHFKTAIEQMSNYGIAWETRIYTDYYSGRSDRVMVEWVLENMGDIDADLAMVMEISEAADFFGGCMGQMNDMIVHSDADNWTIIE